jgi:hypothetical protein
MDQEQRNADRAAVLRQLGEQVERLTDSDEWRSGRIPDLAVTRPSGSAR